MHSLSSQPLICQHDDRIAGVWLSGVELLRTSTPEPSENGTFWNVKKDITKYSSLLKEGNISLSMMLENLVNDEFTGVYHIELSMSFYRDEGVVNNLGRKLGLGFGDLGSGVYEEPADLVIPVAAAEAEAEVDCLGYWFRIDKESDVGMKKIEIPINARKVVLEMYASFHGDDEFWYSNPPNEYIEANNLPTTRGNGAFRELFVKIDGKIVGSEVPFPVIFTGGINPLSWDPLVSIGAFDLPSYDFELTPFLSSLLDGQSHVIEIGVSNAIKYWLIDANLHVWVDMDSFKVEVGMGVNDPAKFEVEREYEFEQLDGSFEIEVEKEGEISGWVASSLGNFTTTIERKMKFENSIEFENGGSKKTVEQKVEVETEVKVVSETGVLVSERKSKRKYPLKIVTSTVPGLEIDTNLITTSISNSLEEESSDGNIETKLKNSQESEGSMLIKDHSILSGTAETRQNLSYKGPFTCFSRSAVAAGGELLSDLNSVCSSIITKGLNKLLSFGRQTGLVF
ncbi:Peptide-N4-(N-acetyl-beta-glucosaminyl)asparagine amidase A [Bienertia sinuspersici]